MRNCTRLGAAAIALAFSLLAACSPRATPAVAAPAATVAPASSSDEPAASAQPAASAEPAAEKVPRKACPAIAGMAASGESFWQSLVQPLSCWTLQNHGRGKPDAD